MTLEEKVRSIVGKKIAILCETEGEARELVRIMNVVNGEDYPVTFTHFGKKKDGRKLIDTCYDLSNPTYWDYNSSEYYSSCDFKVVKFKDFNSRYLFTFKDFNTGYLFAPDAIETADMVTTLTFDNITEILNKTYGKGKWVIK